MRVGKKDDGAYLATRHGYARLKIGYLLEVAAARCGIADVYALDEVGIAELLVLGLEMYCMAHHFQRHVSIESLHRAGVTAELAKLLGERLMVVYLDAAPGLRETRSAAGPADVRERDAVKRSRGAERIRELADVLIDNNGPRLALYRTLHGPLPATAGRGPCHGGSPSPTWGCPPGSPHRRSGGRLRHRRTAPAVVCGECG